MYFRISGNRIIGPLLYKYKICTYLQIHTYLQLQLWNISMCITCYIIIIIITDAFISDFQIMTSQSRDILLSPVTNRVVKFPKFGRYQWTFLVWPFVTPCIMFPMGLLLTNLNMGDLFNPLNEPSIYKWLISFPLAMFNGVIRFSALCPCIFPLFSGMGTTFLRYNYLMAAVNADGPASLFTRFLIRSLFGTWPFLWLFYSYPVICMMPSNASLFAGPPSLQWRKARPEIPAKMDGRCCLNRPCL